MSTPTPAPAPRALRAAMHALHAERRDPLRISTRPLQRAWHAGALGVALAFVLAGGVQAWRSARMRAAHGAWVQHTHAVMRTLDLVRVAVATTESSERGYLLTGDERYLHRGAGAPQSARAALASARRLTSDNASQQARLAMIAPLLEARLARSAEVVARARRGDRQAAIVLVRDYDGESLAQRLDQRLQEGAEAERQLLATRLAAESTASAAMQVNLALVGIGVLLTVIAGVWLLRREAVRTQRAFAAAAHSQARFRRILETVRTPALMLDPMGVITFANDALCEVTGWSRDELIGEEWFERCVPEGPEREARRATFASRILTGAIPPHVEALIHTRDGETRLLAWDNTVLRDASGQITGTASIGRDVTRERELLERLESQAHVDELTGLLNRRGFHTAAEREWQRAERDGLGLVAVALDLDRFKAINDTHGHAEGDAALRMLADVLRATFRGADVVGRMGGDEFVALVVPGGPHPGDADVLSIERQVRERIRMHLDAANAAERLAGRTWDVRTSIGTVSVPAGAPRPASLAALLRQADERLYAEKSGRRFVAA